jgi:hypothetical protein
MNLFDLARRVQYNAERFAYSRNNAGLAEHLRARLEQISEITERAKTLQTRRHLMAQVEPTIRIPKRKLVQRIRTVENLESSTANDVATIIQRDALDSDAFGEAFDEVETTMLDLWRKFARPAREVRTEGLDSVAGLAAVVQELRTLRLTLDARGRELPADAAALEQVAKLKVEITTLTDRILTSGYPEEVLSFIAQSRHPRGISLADILKNPTLRKWLEEKNHAAAFRIIHESVSQPSAFPP